jgi:ATP-binding cassette subfamily C (CFTR/MRP) protein 1
VLLVIVTSVQTVLLSQYFYRMYLVGIWIRASVTSAIYRKALRVSQSSKKDITTGEIVNLMSVERYFLSVGMRL